MARKRKAHFTAAEMKKLMNVSDKQNYVFMPNEIYADFSKAFSDLKKEANVRSSHIAYAFGYTFLAHYMWRYANYYWWDDAKGNIPINEAIIKQLLGFDAKAEAYTYLTKNRVGFMEQIGYIRKVTDKPVAHYWEDEDHIDLAFEMESKSSTPTSYKINRKGWKVAMPIKGIWRTADDEANPKIQYPNGTIYEYGNTHMVDMETFIYCITHPELGVEGFYLYSFLKYKTDKFNNAFDCSIENMATMTGLSIDEIKSQINNLERYNMITNDHKPYCLNKPKDKTCKANTYGVLKYNQFAQNLIQMRVIPKQLKVSKERYEHEIGWANEREVGGNIVDTNTGEIIRPAKSKISIDDNDMSELDDLPFD
ncbi:hypothetical protein [Paenibacillus sp. R14(2021)]|uniref:hypothetical protein n=1 Tax=Paenibacillus sp. R14(2021) TaxID=2859228 RepID=UPI001C6128FA|nr:hypothetical protein [Paenibacillus sp. R14(2021)]